MCSEPHTTYTFSKELNFAHLHVLKLGQYLKKRRNGIWLKIALLSQIWAQGVLVKAGSRVQPICNFLQTAPEPIWPYHDLTWLVTSASGHSGRDLRMPVVDFGVVVNKFQSVRLETQSFDFKSSHKQCGFIDSDFVMMNDDCESTHVSRLIRPKRYTSPTPPKKRISGEKG